MESYTLSDGEHTVDEVVATWTEHLFCAECIQEMPFDCCRYTDCSEFASCAFCGWDDQLYGVNGKLGL